MTIFLIIISCIFAYAFAGGFVGGRHHAISSRECNHSDHFNSYWCNHVHRSFWLFGLLWWLALPVSGGILMGASDSDTRKARKRAREIAEAKHKAELQRIAAQEDADLDRRLAALERKSR